MGPPIDGPFPCGNTRKKSTARQAFFAKNPTNTTLLGSDPDSPIRNAIDPQHYRQVALDAVQHVYPITYLAYEPARWRPIGQIGYDNADKASRYTAQEAPAFALAAARASIDCFFTVSYGISIRDPTKAKQLFIYHGALAVAVSAVARAIGSYFWGEVVIMGTETWYPITIPPIEKYMTSFESTSKELDGTKVKRD